MLRRSGVYIIASIILLFAVTHIIFSPAEHSPRTIIPTMIGGSAFLLMTTSIVLSTRLNYLEDWFGGLDRMYQVHRVAGVFAAILVLIHMISAPKTLPLDADPDLYSVFPSAVLGKIALVLLVIGLFLALNRKIGYSRWRPTHKSMVLVYLLATGHFLTAPGLFFQLSSPSGIVLIIAVVIGVPCAFYTVLGMNKRTSLPFTIEAVNNLERATELVLKATDKMPEFKPGQFAFLEIEGSGWDEPHPFTISSSPQENRLRFTVKVLGDWTRKVREELEPGRQALIRGPYGRFDYEKAGDRQVWLAGGIGITPFLSMIRAMDNKNNKEIYLLYAAREQKDALYLEELTGKIASLPQVSIVPIYSEQGCFARVDIMKKKLPDPLNSYDFFLCGPKPMIDGIRADLYKEGVPRPRIHTEAFEFR